MAALPRHEKETTLSFTEGDETLSFFTYSKRFASKMRYLGVKPVSVNGYGGMFFEVPVSWFRLPRPPKKRRGKRPSHEGI